MTLAEEFYWAASETNEAIEHQSIARNIESLISEVRSPCNVRKVFRRSSVS